MRLSTQSATRLTEIASAAIALIATICAAPATPAGAEDGLLDDTFSTDGLLLIGWSASFTYISMERFWRPGAAP